MKKGDFINSDRISPEIRRKLAKHLQGRFDEDSIERFLISVSETVDTMEKTAETGLPDNEIKTYLEQIETLVRRLNNELSQMDERTFDTVALHFKTLLQSSDWDTKDLKHLRQDQPDFKEWLGRSLEDLRIMDIVFHYTHSKIDISNDQRGNIKKRVFVERVVRIYIREFGVKPVPKQWFITFMSELGKAVGIKIGKGAANNAIKKHN
jgi:hypothetical protein